VKADGYGVEVMGCGTLILLNAGRCNWKGAMACMQSPDECHEVRRMPSVRRNMP
jgi:hypothetical protein